MGTPTRLNPTFENLGWEIQPDRSGLISVTLLGRSPVRVQPPLVEAVSAMDFVLDHTGYENPCDWVGSWFYRDIDGTDGLASGHAYAVCIDLDYGGDNPESPDHPLVDNNPHVHRRIVRGDPGFGTEWQILEHQVDAIEAIRNTDGKQIWSWRIGWILGDSMHWQPLVGPDECEVDWSTVAGYKDEEEPVEVFKEFVAGWVRGLAADPTKTRQEFTRLNTEQQSDGGYILEPANDPATVDYFMDHLDDEYWSEWPGMYARTELSVWGR